MKNGETLPKGALLGKVGEGVTGKGKYQQKKKRKLAGIFDAGKGPFLSGSPQKKKEANATPRPLPRKIQSGEN